MYLSAERGSVLYALSHLIRRLRQDYLPLTPQNIARIGIPTWCFRSNVAYPLQVPLNDPLQYDAECTNADSSSHVAEVGAHGGKKTLDSLLLGL